MSGERNNPNQNTMLPFFLEALVQLVYQKTRVSSRKRGAHPTRVRDDLSNLSMYIRLTVYAKKEGFCAISGRVSDKSQSRAVALLVFLITASKLGSARAARRRSVFSVLFLKRNKFAESQGVIATPRSDWPLPERCLARYQESPSKRRKFGSCCPIASSPGGASGLGPARSRKP